MISNGLNNYISQVEGKQQKDGGFPAFASGEAAGKSGFAGAKSVLYTSLILFSLNHQEETLQTKAIKQKAADFLLSRRDVSWVFSEDVGVNFCVLAALSGYSKEILNGEAIAKILTKLISIESKEGGPYYSRFAGSGKGPDKTIDLASNGNIACFLFSQEVELPNLNELVESAIEKDNFESASYASIYPVIYFISQFYKGAKKEKLAELILKRKGSEKHWGNPLNASMAISALLNLGYPAGKIAEESNYLKNLPEDELFKSYPLEKDKLSTAELNIAFYLEALEKITGKNDSVEPGKPKEKTVVLNAEESEMFDRILKLAKERFSTLRGGMKDIALGEIQRTMQANLDKQMSLMPYYFKKALGRKAEKMPDSMIVRLGLMNIFFWTAFIIYDDFWDEEGTPKILPTANLYARNFIEYFGELFSRGSDFNPFFRELMDRLDAGNTWILANCRAKVSGNKIEIPAVIPDYGDYEVAYEPSSAHILGPVAMLYSLGYRMDFPEIRTLISYFRNYLIAMQINDDIYDWEEDLRRGHLSTVVVELLRDFHRPKGEIDMEADLVELRKTFWFKTLPRVCRIAIDHTQRSLGSLKKLAILQNPAPLENLVRAIEDVSKAALKEQKYTEDFLKAYKN